MRTLLTSGVLAALVSTAMAGDALDRAQIQAGIAKVKAKVMACGNGAKIGGTIKIRATVDAAGKVTSADATGDDADLGACVVKELKGALFAKTASGATFSYPFVFDKVGKDSTAVRSKTPGKSKPAGPPGEDPFGATPPPQELDRASISAGIAKVKTKVMACGDSTKGTGKVKVEVKVAPDGKVTSVTAEPNEKLGACVAAAVKTAVFAKTDVGGSFSYPFVFGSAAPPPPTIPPVPPGQGSAAPPPTNELDRAAISDGIAKVKAKVADCGKTSKAKGSVKVKVIVAKDGTVTSATIDVTPDEALGKCVAGVIKAAKFKATNSGGAFSYPFVF